VHAVAHAAALAARTWEDGQAAGATLADVYERVGARPPPASRGRGLRLRFLFFDNISSCVVIMVS
jgi:hypothetical protein